MYGVSASEGRVDGEGYTDQCKMGLALLQKEFELLKATDDYDPYSRHARLCGSLLYGLIRIVFYVPEAERGEILSQIRAIVFSYQDRAIVLNATFAQMIYGTFKRERCHWFLDTFKFDITKGYLNEFQGAEEMSTMTWLEYAVSYHATESVNFLVDEKGVSVDQLEKRLLAHGAPLHRAVEGKDRRMIELLLGCVLIPDFEIQS